MPWCTRTLLNAYRAESHGNFNHHILAMESCPIHQDDECLSHRTLLFLALQQPRQRTFQHILPQAHFLWSRSTHAPCCIHLRVHCRNFIASSTPGGHTCTNRMSMSKSGMVMVSGGGSCAWNRQVCRTVWAVVEMGRMDRGLEVLLWAYGSRVPHSGVDDW